MNSDNFNDDFFNDYFETDMDDDVEENDDSDSAYEIELTNVKRRTAVLTKNDMIAVLGLQTFDQGGTICRIDPREEKPSMQLYDNPQEALDWFARSLRTSRKNGWAVVYDGLPLHG